MKRLIAIAMCGLILFSQAFAQQIQTLEDTDSLKQRRVKTNANFTLLKDQFNNSASLLADQLAAALSGTADLTSVQTLEKKTLKAPRIFSYTKATLPGDALAGTIAIVTDDQRGLWTMAASGVWQPFEDGQISGGLFGMDATGETDSSAALAASIVAANASGLPIVLKNGTYTIKDAIPGTLKNVSIVGNGAIIKKITGGTHQGILFVDYGTYEGWKFSGVKFDGGGIGSSPFNLSQAKDLTFEDCSFRNYIGAVLGQGSRNISFRRCKFYGTKPGVMAEGSQDPSAVAGAAYGTGTQWNEGCENISFDDCDFHFCSQGIVTVGTSAGSNVSDSVRGVRVTNCRFRADWFNNPYKTGEWTVSAYSDGTLDISSGSFSGFFNDFQTVCFPVQIRTGTEFTNTFANVISATNIGLAASFGDVIETADGRRAEIAHVTSNDQVEVLGWESIDTFEPTSAPALSADWRLRRFYSTTAQTHVSDTRIQLYQTPVNMFTGHTVVDDSISLVGRTFRTFAKMGYSGVHINNSYDVLVERNRFRGAWADQVSSFYSRQVRIAFNTIEFGQDQAITVTTCPGAVVEGNTVRNEGVGIFIGSNLATVSNNTIYNWNLHNFFDGLGAIQLVGLGISATGNTFDYDHSISHSGFSARCFSMYLGEMSGSVLSNNTGSARLGQVYVGDDGAGSIVSVTVRDMSWSGPESAHVKGTLAATATLDFGSTAAQSSADLTLTLAGALVGDVVSLGVPNGSLSASSSFSAWISATDTVTVRFNNYSAGAIDPASGSFRVQAIRF